jgi:hypothetical protein
METTPRFSPPTPGQPAWLSPPTIRSRLALEVASELVGAADWPYVRARVVLDAPDVPSLALETGGRLNAIHQVARDEVQVALMNPAAPLALAVRGLPPFDAPVELRAIAVLPSADALGFAVAARTGLTSLGDVAKLRYPLRVSLRGQRDHTIHVVMDRLFEEVGFSLADLVAWGGAVRYDRELPWGPNRLGAVVRGEIDAVFDEAVWHWADRALAQAVRFLPVEDEVLARLEQSGLRRTVIPRADFPALPADVPTLDFSGWALFTHARVPDEVVGPICAALEARRDRIPWEGDGPLPLEQMCRDTPEAPLTIPLHPAAERFWRARGYLPG